MGKPTCIVCGKESGNVWHVVGECSTCEGKTIEILNRLGEIDGNEYWCWEKGCKYKCDSCILGSQCAAHYIRTGNILFKKDLDNA